MLVQALPVGSGGPARTSSRRRSRRSCPPARCRSVAGDGAVGGRLVSDARVRAITLTGGIPAGAAVARAAAPNMARLQLELGGSNAAIVRADADLAVTAHALARGMTKLNGQWCEAPRRVLVPDALHDEL